MISIRTILPVVTGLTLLFIQPALLATDANASNLQQRAPQQQQQLLKNLPAKSTSSKTNTDTGLPVFEKPGSEEQHHEQAQILYNYLRNKRGLSHEDALSELMAAEFPTDQIVQP